MAIEPSRKKTAFLGMLVTGINAIASLLSLPFKATYFGYAGLTSVLSLVALGAFVGLTTAFSVVSMLIASVVVAVAVAASSLGIPVGGKGIKFLYETFIGKQLDSGASLDKNQSPSDLATAAMPADNSRDMALNAPINFASPVHSSAKLAKEQSLIVDASSNASCILKP